MNKKRYLVFLFLKAKNVAMEYAENLDFVRTIKALYRHDKAEVIDMGTFGDEPEEKPEPAPKKRRPRPWATKIRCVETGEVWPSIAECQRKTGIAFFSLNNACKTGKPVYGHHYEYIKEENGNK